MSEGCFVFCGQLATNVWPVAAAQPASLRTKGTWDLYGAEGLALHSRPRGLETVLPKTVTIG